MLNLKNLLVLYSVLNQNCCHVCMMQRGLGGGPPQIN